MNPNKHLKIAGALQVVQGSILLLFASWYVVLLIPEFQAGSMELGELLTFILILTTPFFLGGVQAWFGYALIRQKQWTTMAIGYICCVPGFLFFPLVISAYTLWVLMQVNKKEAGLPEPVN